MLRRGPDRSGGGRAGSARPGRAAGRRAPLALLGAALALAGGSACSGDGAARKGDAGPAPVAVEIVEVQPRLLRDVVDLVGQLESELTVQVRPDTEGVLETVEFAEGEAVARGDVLFRLESDEERARLRETQAEARLARSVYERTRRLAKRDIAAEAQLDRAEAELAREQARVEAARAALEKTVIRAPFDGMMGAVWVSPGARVEPDIVLTQIDAIDRLQLLFTLPEKAISMARPGIPVEFRVAPYPDDVFEGEVYFVAPSIDPDTRRLLVKAWVSNPDHRLRPGLFANIRAEVGRKDDALMVPESALALDRAGTFVWRVNEGDAVERQPVETGLRVEGRVEITGGLRPGDRVVAAGTNKVRAGEVVRAAGPAESRRAEPAGEPRAAARSGGASAGSDPGEGS